MLLKCIKGGKAHNVTIIDVVYVGCKMCARSGTCWYLCFLKQKPTHFSNRHMGNALFEDTLGQRESSFCTSHLVLSTYRHSKSAPPLPPNRQTCTLASWKSLQPLICPLVKVNENTTHMCLLRAFLFWLENESVEEIENKRCSSSVPLGQIRLAQARTSAWQGSTHCLQF